MEQPSHRVVEEVCITPGADIVRHRVTASLGISVPIELHPLRQVPGASSDELAI